MQDSVHLLGKEKQVHAMLPLSARKEMLPAFDMSENRFKDKGKN